MPGSVENAVCTTVLPWSLCKAFGHAREYVIVDNRYRNGESQRGLLTQTSRKRWTTVRRLAPVLLEAFREFYEARKGPLEPFYFYDPWETNPKFSYDPTGENPVGRYTVRFDCPWSQTVGMGRADVEISLVEVA